MEDKMMMDFNWMGALTKQEVIALLSNKGCNVKDVHELNLIMEEMGLLICSDGKWSTTKEAEKYTSSNSQIDDEVLWRPSVIDAIYKFTKE